MWVSFSDSSHKQIINMDRVSVIETSGDGHVNFCGDTVQDDFFGDVQLIIKMVFCGSHSASLACVSIIEEGILGGEKAIDISDFIAEEAFEPAASPCDN